MERLFQPLLFFLAKCSRNQLIRQIEFLKAENEMLRKRVPKQRIWLKPEEKERLLTLGLAIGPDLKLLLSIVSYDTIRRWRRQKFGFTPKNRGRLPEGNSLRNNTLFLPRRKRRPKPGLLISRPFRWKKRKQPLRNVGSRLACP